MASTAHKRHGMDRCTTPDGYMLYDAVHDTMQTTFLNAVPSAFDEQAQREHPLGMIAGTGLSGTYRIVEQLQPRIHPPIGMLSIFATLRGSQNKKP